jgi:hypothetical protein
MSEFSQDQLRQLCEAMGWQGGTFHQVLARVHALRGLVREALAAGDAAWFFGTDLEGRMRSAVAGVTPTDPVAWGVFALIEGAGWVLQFPVRDTQARAEQDRAMYAAGERLQVLPLTVGVAQAPAPATQQWAVVGWVSDRVCLDSEAYSSSSKPGFSPVYQPITHMKGAPRG